MVSRTRATEQTAKEILTMAMEATITIPTATAPTTIKTRTVRRIPTTGKDRLRTLLQAAEVAKAENHKLKRKEQGNWRRVLMKFVVLF